jgi:hypothetical protein
MRAMHGFWSGLAERPTYKKKSGRQTLRLTSELFKFKPAGKTNSKQDKTIYDRKLMLGTLTHSLGELCFKAHVEYALPASGMILPIEPAGRSLIPMLRSLYSRILTYRT